MPSLVRVWTLGLDEMGSPHTIWRATSIDRETTHALPKSIHSSNDNTRGSRRPQDPHAPRPTETIAKRRLLRKLSRLDKRMLLALRILQRRRLGLLQQLRQPKQIMHPRPPPLNIPIHLALLPRNATLISRWPANATLSHNPHRPRRAQHRPIQTPHFLHKMRRLPPQHPPNFKPLPLSPLHLQNRTQHPTRRLRHLHILLPPPRQLPTYQPRERQ